MINWSQTSFTSHFYICVWILGFWCFLNDSLSAKWVNCTECWFGRHAHINKLWTETTNGTAPICWFWRHAHINKLWRRTRQKQQMVRHPFVDLPDGSTIQIVDSAPILIFLVIPKQQSGSRVLYAFLTNMQRKYFFLNILTVGDQPEVEFLNFDQNWASTRPLLLKTLGPSNYSL